MIEKLKLFEKTRTDLINEVKEFVQNKEHSLDSRWDVYCIAGKLNIIPKETSTFEPDGIDWSEVSLYDNFNIERHEHYNYKRLEKECIRLNYFKQDDENHIAFKESWLNAFIYDVEFDW